MWKPIKISAMKLLSELQPADFSNLLLFGAILLANIDYISIADYVIKAVLGGAIWFVFHLLQDYYSEKMKEKPKRNLKPRKPG
jgi:hypothetical protein